MLAVRPAQVADCGRAETPCAVQEICIGANTLMRERPAALEPRIDDFISYILAAMQHADAEVAIEATTFWILYLECGLPLDRLAPRLPKVVELLLQYMVFEEHDEEVVAALEAEAGGGRESDADLRPFHSARGGGGSGNGATWTDTEDGSRSGQGAAGAGPAPPPFLLCHTLL